ncbi:MAG: Zinc protease [Parcubacteria group bacterium]|nr:Zinc protease [Parcubacteria group bacterium]
MNPIASSITEFEFAHGERVFVAPTGAKNLVSIEGSVLGGWASLSGSAKEVPGIASEIFDAGTKTKGKDFFRETLAARGASLDFVPGADRTSFYGSCFPEDVTMLLTIIAECLAGAEFPASEVKAAKERAFGNLKESLTDTRTQAGGALMRAVYAPDHVNYAETTNICIKHTEKVTRAELVSFRKTLGKRGLVMSLAGDIHPSDAKKAVEKALKLLPEGTFTEDVQRPNKKISSASETLVSIKDKANIDTYLGVAVPLTYDSKEFLPFMAVCSMLGGRGLSSGHLMRTIRERDGYTYGIYCMPTGFEKNTEGMFRIWATFSPATYEKAVAATRKEINFFFKNGITEEALEFKKSEISGSYLVSLSTSKGMAAVLHKIGREGKPLSYIDEYPALIRALTLSEIKEAAALIPLSKLSLAAAGSFIK